ncbi:MAG: RNase adapter RapZ [Eubacterium sp.]|nr:RNase adapter RapZ [Eubacterium sp.]
MKFVIVTGLSGAGKTATLKMFEDFGYFCVDNLPIELVEKFAELSINHPRTENVALGLDARSGDDLDKMDVILAHLKELGIDYKIVFLDSSNEILIKRYKETRRRHPLSEDGRIHEGIQKEREQLQFLRQHADYIFDTSHLLIRDLRKDLQNVFVENKQFGNMMVNIVSFGYKYGIPADADLVFDVRFLPNPYYVEELKKKTGNDREVRDYVMGDPESEVFLNKLEDMITFLLPKYCAEGKNQLVIAIGCTGGKHRSVTIAKLLYDYLSEEEIGGFGYHLGHKDIEKGKTR